MTGRAASWMRRVLGTIFGAWLVAIGALFIFQRSLLFPRPRPLPVPADAAWIDVGDSRVPLLRRGPEGAPRVAWFHGNGGQLAGQEWLTDALAAHGVATVAMEYPGYGAATGSPSEADLLAAARASLAWVGEPAPTCVAHSLGTGVAAAMAAEGRCRALVLVSAYTSIAEVAVTKYPFVPRFLVLDRFDTLRRAPSIRVPTLLIHGRDDGLVPVAMGRSLAAAIPGARLVERAGGHGNIFDEATFAAIAAMAKGEPG